MVCLAMGVQWNTYGIQFWCFAILFLFLGIQGCWSLNLEGLALLEFRARVDYDPTGTFANWNSNDNDPCTWSGVHCVDGKVENLDLKGLSLVGVLAPNLGKLFHLRSLVLYNNHFFGAIPKEIGGLTMLEVLDLRNNDLTGAIPAEIGGLQSLKRLLLCNNKFEGEIPLELQKLNFLSELQFDENLKATLSTGIGSVNRKFGHWQLRYLCSRFKSERDSLHSPEYSCSGNLPREHKINLVQNVQNLVNIARRRLLQLSSNLAALPATGKSPSEQITTLPTTRSSGSFPAVPKAKKGQSDPPVASPTSPSPQHYHATSNPDSQATGSANKSTSQSPPSGNTWKYIVLTSGIALLFIVAAVMFFMCRKQPVTNIGPWKTGLSGQLQKAFVTGVPKLNRAELETACEDFSNIIDTIDGCTIYKGTLSSGVEIAVASSAMLSAKDWTKRSELSYRKKIDTLSRVNHKNFVNLIGFCEEEEPFARMMVFEYAPNGTLFEHLHVKEVEHLDWSARMRIIMGTAYCLQYMHELNPPVAHSNLNSNSIFLTDDYAAKIAEISIDPVSSKEKTSEEDESEHSELPPLSDPETNVYCFGIMLLEIISGKVPCSEEGSLVLNWAAEYLNNKRKYLIDPTLTSYKESELDIICETIQDCIQQDARKRPTMREITSKLNEVIGISPDAATPRLSPLWWAELEILSSEAN